MRVPRRKLGIVLAAWLCAAVGASSGARAQTVLHRWTGPEPGAAMGASVANAGDLDGDGRDDLIVGAPDYRYSFAMQAARGFVTVRSGRTGTTLFRFVGTFCNPHIGSAVGPGGDVNGDGVPDFLFGGAWTGYYASSVSVHSGLTGNLLHLKTGNYTLTPALGQRVLGGFDLDGDGFDDFVATAPGGLGAGKGQLIAYSGATGDPLYVANAKAGASGFGAGLASLEDLDGDGVSELVVGAPGSGQVQVLSGLDGQELYELSGSGGFGRDIAALGDVTGDGLDDFVVGANQANGGEGRAYVHSGMDGAFVRELHGSHPGGGFGFAVAGPGDVNGDGTPDVVVGAPFDDELFPGAGRITVFCGADGSELMVLYGSQADDRLGVSIAGAGDVDGGGLPDLLAGAPAFASPAGGPGEALVWASERSPGVYCTAKTNSLGCAPTVWSSGVPSLSASDFRLSAYGVVNERPGVLLWSLRPAHVPWLGGFECVGRVEGRRLLWSGGNPGAVFPQPDCSGSLRDDWSSAFLASVGLTPGQAVHAQFVYEDPGDPTGVGLTDALRFEVLP